jgi:hypothetical protein
MRNTYKTLFFVMLVLLSCSEEQYEQATITFYPNLTAEVDEPATGMSGSPYIVELVTSRVLAQETKVNIRIEGNGAGYGYSYTTFPPQLEPGIVTVTIPAGEKNTFFSFTPLGDGIVEIDNYNYTFTIAEANASVRSIGQGVFRFTVIEPPLFEEYFDECSGTPPQFIEKIAEGAMTASTWGCTDFGFPDESTSAAEANAFGKGEGQSNSYLVIEEPLDGTTFDELIVDCKVYSRFSGAGALKILYSTNYSGDGNPEAEGVTWTELDGTSAAMPAAGSRTWTDVRGSVQGIGDEPVYIAFQYKGGTTSSASNWRVENVIIKAK